MTDRIVKSKSKKSTTGHAAEITKDGDTVTWSCVSWCGFSTTHPFGRTGTFQNAAAWNTHIRSAREARVAAA